ncbi:MAG: hypothetical protein HGA19_02830 [Oscillochloris sp.]|nr:hypothetical protein [Oscillochloris sp.]
MAVEFVYCPVCKQKLALQDYISSETLVVCANAKCGADLRVLGRSPARIELVPQSVTHSTAYRPESYG